MGTAIAGMWTFSCISNDNTGIAAGFTLALFCILLLSILLFTDEKK